MTAPTLGPIFKRVRIVVSDEHCLLGAKRYRNVPMLVDRCGQIIWVASSWLRGLLVKNSDVKTVGQYAYSLCLFWAHLESLKGRGEQGLDWTEVDDEVLRVWRDQVSARPGRNGSLDSSTVNAHLDVVIAFYLWAEKEAHCNGVIGELAPGKVPYPISVERRRVRGRIAFKTPLRLRERRKRRRPIPTSEEMSELYVLLGGPTAKNVRDCLMCKWLAGTGLRIHELLSIELQDLPSEYECRRLAKEGKLGVIKVLGKFKRERAVPVLAELLLEAHDYIEYSRPELLAKGPCPYSKYLFVGRSANGRLSREHASRVVAGAFDRMNADPGLSTHRIRARFASLLMQELLAEQTENATRAGGDVTLFELATHPLGHGVETMKRSYLNLALDRQSAATRSAGLKSSGYDKQ